MAKSCDRRVICHHEGEELPRGWYPSRVLDGNWSRAYDECQCRDCRGPFMRLIEIRPMTMRERLHAIYFRPDIDRIGLRRSRLADGGPRWVAL